jgi:hypothetical protein
LFAFATEDRKWHHDSVALFELAVHTVAEFDHFSHHFMSHDVAWQHRRNEIVEQVKIRTAYRTACHFDNRVSRILDLGIGDSIATDILFAVPNEGSHVCILLVILGLPLPRFAPTLISILAGGLPSLGRLGQHFRMWFVALPFLIFANPDDGGRFRRDVQTKGPQPLLPAPPKRDLTLYCNKSRRSAFFRLNGLACELADATI